MPAVGVSAPGKCLNILATFCSRGTTTVLVENINSEPTSLFEIQDNNNISSSAFKNLDKRK